MPAIPVNIKVIQILHRCSYLRAAKPRSKPPNVTGWPVSQPNITTILRLIPAFSLQNWERSPVNCRQIATDPERQLNKILYRQLLGPQVKHRVGKTFG